MTIRRRLALALCRAAGLTTIAANRFETDELRESNRKLAATVDALGKLMQTMARQTNSNTLMLKRWLESSPALQLVEKAAQRKNASRIILPPNVDIRTTVPVER